MNSALRCGCGVFVGVLFLAAGMVRGAPVVDWGTDVDVFLFQANSVDLVTGGDTTTGGFVQLIDLGVNGEYDGISLLADDGIHPDGDDNVVATAWVGQGLLGIDGEFFTLNTTYNTTGKSFVIRFFELASPDYVEGKIPTSGKYGLSEVFPGTSHPTRDEFYIQESVSAVYAIPEPGSIALLLGAGLALGLRRRRIG